MTRFLDKYRPRRFADYSGIQHFMPVITRIVEEQLWHGIIITGEPGMGKSTLARILVSRLLCEQPRGIEPCLSCGPCKQMTPGTMNPYIEQNMKSGSAITKSWTDGLFYDLMHNSMFFFPRHVWVEDIDAAPTAVVQTLFLVFDMHITTPMFFTASDLSSLPPPFVHRMKCLRLRKARKEDLVPFVSSVCDNEGIRVAEPGAVFELIRLANCNYRNILNILESIRDFGDSLSIDRLSEDHVLDNLGLQVGSPRYVALKPPKNGKK